MASADGPAHKEAANSSLPPSIHAIPSSATWQGFEELREPSAAAPAPARERWSSEGAFLLASIGSAIGFGNIWRFPMLAFEYGGGAFLVPYLLSLFIVAIPMVVLEFGLGQLCQRGHVRLVRRLEPRAEGFGWAPAVGSFLITQYYNALLAYAAVYFVRSFASPLPWEAPGWTPTRFFYDGVVQPSGSVEALGGIVPGLAVAYCVVWGLVYAGVRGGARSLGWLNNLVMPAPFAILLVLLARGLSLEGAGEGVRALFRPDWAVLRARPDVWLVAMGQILFGVSAGMGVLTTYASYSPRSARAVRAAFVVCLSNSAFSVLAAVAVFAFLGHMAHEQGRPLGEVVSGGTALAFEVFPHAVALLPLPQLWAAAFFLMLLNLGLSSAASDVTPLAVALSEAAARSRRPWLGPTVAARAPAVLHGLGCATGLIYVSGAGLYWIDVANHFIPMLNTVVTCLGECLLVTATVGARPLADAIARASGETAGLGLLAWLWKAVIPASLAVMLAVQCFAEARSPFGGYPGWVLALGWVMALGPLVAIPIVWALRSGASRDHALRGAALLEEDAASGDPAGSAPARAAGLADVDEAVPEAATEGAPEAAGTTPRPPTPPPGGAIPSMMH